MNWVGQSQLVVGRTVSVEVPPLRSPVSSRFWSLYTLDFHEHIEFSTSETNSSNVSGTDPLLKGLYHEASLHQPLEK